MARNQNTAVVVLKDFRIRTLPFVPQIYINRIDAGVWKEFTDQIQANINNTFSQTHDMSKVASIRCRLYFAYMLCAPATCIFAFLTYYTLGIVAVLGIYSIQPI